MGIVALFPGQGSQKVGMGKDLYEQFETAKELFKIADEVLEKPISKLCFEGPSDELTLTENAQPALLTVAYICYKLSEKVPEACSGHSLGEYTALTASGVISFPDAVKLVQKRGRYMQEAVPVGEGGMAAIMGGDLEELENIVASSGEGNVQVANYNCPGQTVIAGKSANLKEVSEKLSSGGFKVIPLSVSAPFHSALMRPAAEKLKNDIDSINFSEPEIPVYSNVTAEIVPSAEEAKKLLVEQVYSPVKWTEIISKLSSSYPDSNFVEFGPGGVLSKLVKRIDKSLTRTEVGSVEGVKSFK